MLGTFLLPNSRLTGGVPLIGILVVHGKGAKMPAGAEHPLSWVKRPWPEFAAPMASSFALVPVKAVDVKKSLRRWRS